MILTDLIRDPLLNLQNQLLNSAYISPVRIASHDMKNTATRLLKTVKPDLTEAHVLFKLIKAAS